MGGTHPEIEREREVGGASEYLLVSSILGLSPGSCKRHRNEPKPNQNIIAGAQMVQAQWLAVFISNFTKTKFFPHLLSDHGLYRSITKVHTHTLSTDAFPPPL